MGTLSRQFRFYFYNSYPRRAKKCARYSNGDFSSTVLVLNSKKKKLIFYGADEMNIILYLLSQTKYVIKHYTQKKKIYAFGHYIIVNHNVTFPIVYTAHNTDGRVSHSDM